MISLSVHYDFPYTASELLLVAGKVPSRFSRKTIALWFVTIEDYYRMHEFEDTIGCSIKELPMDLSNIIF